MGNDDGIPLAFTFGFVLGAVAMALSWQSCAAVKPDAIHHCADVCADNGGVKWVGVDKECGCENGARFEGLTK